MPASDDENDRGESEPYEIESEKIAYYSDHTLSDMLGDALSFLKKGKLFDLDAARASIKDVLALIERNPDMQVSDELDMLELPPSWTTAEDDEPDDDEPDDDEE